MKHHGSPDLLAECWQCADGRTFLQRYEDGHRNCEGDDGRVFGGGSGMEVEYRVHGVAEVVEVVHVGVVPQCMM